MADQCVPVSSQVTVTIAQKGSKSKNCSVTFKAKMKHHHENEKEESTSNQLGIKRKRRKRRIPAKQKWEIISHPKVPNIKQTHKKAKRRPAVKDKRREIHRQNERFRHQSLNMAIKKLSMLVPHGKPHRSAVKHHVVQNTGEYLEFLNNQVTWMCNQLRVSKRATLNCFSFNQQMIASFDHKEKHHPAGKAVTLSSLEGLLDNMHIENRHYSRKEPTIKREKNEKFVKEQTKLPQSHHLEARLISDPIYITENNPQISLESSELISPTSENHESKNKVLRGSYLGDAEFSQSSSINDFSEGTSSGDITDMVLSSSTSNSGSSEDTFSGNTTSPSNLSDISEAMPFLTDQEATLRSVEKLQFVQGPPRLIFDSSTKLMLQPVGWVSSLDVQRPTASCKLSGTVCNLSADQGSSRKDENEQTTSWSSSRIMKDATKASHGTGQGQLEAVNGGLSIQRSWINGYQLFVKVNHPHFKQAWPHLQGRDISCLLAQAWNDLPEDVKKIYSDKACTWNQEHKKLQEQASEQ